MGGVLAVSTSLVAGGLAGFAPAPDLLRLGAGLTPHAIGFQVAAATLGIAALPSAHGLVADAFGPGAIPIALTAVAALLAAGYALLARAAPAAAPPPAGAVTSASAPPRRS